MPAHPPHLPPKSCQVTTHYRLQSLGHFLATVLIAFLSGLTATLVTVAWLLPIFVPEESFRIIAADGRRTVAPAGVPEPSFIQDVRWRTVTLYDTRLLPAAGVYPAHARAGMGVLLSSDGWIAAPRAERLVPAASLLVLDEEGRAHDIEQTVTDARSALVFIKIKTDGMRIVGFAQEEEIALGSFLWGYASGRWYPTAIETTVAADTGKEPFPIWADQSVVTLSPAPEAGSALFTGSGAFAGFVLANGRALLSWHVEHQLGGILTEGKSAYMALPWTGYMVDHVVRGNAIHPVAGWYVADAGATAARQGDAAPVQSGDVLVELQGSEITQETLARQMLLSPSSVSVVIVRNGVEQEVLVEKTPLE